MVLKIKKQIQDNVHGYISLTESEMGVIDTPIFQRLRNIKQLGATYLVYPGAMHTRYAHSLGTLFMMDLFLRSSVKMEVSDEDAEKLRLAGMLHDIGHYPFSHTLEHTIVESLKGKSHEEFGTEIIKKFLAEKLENYSVEEITRIISGKGKKEFGMLLSSSLDADKSDYMLRDSYNTGVPYGKVGIASLLRLITFERDKIIFEKDASPVENFLLGRFHLYRTVMHHKTALGFNLLLQGIFKSMVEDGSITNPNLLLDDYGELLGYTDDLVMQSMHSYLRNGSNEITKEMIRMFTCREPLEAAYMEADLVEGNKGSKEREAIKKLQQDSSFRKELAEKAGIEQEWIFPAALRLNFIEEESEIYIRKREGLVPLSKGNAVILDLLLGKTLHDSRIYTKRGYGKKVREAFAKMV